MMQRPRRQIKKIGKFRSPLEVAIARQLQDNNASFEYESEKFRFHMELIYTPDFILPNGIVIEAKGRFTPHDRQRLDWFRKCYPDVDLRMVFTNPNTKLYKNSKSTYASWCEKRGIPYAKKSVPKEWLQ